MGDLNSRKKEQIIQKLKDRGCRITKQRILLLNIILEGDCASCKDIYYQASRQDPNIGPATVYRMINLLEEIGAISPGNQYRIQDADAAGYQIRLADNSSVFLTEASYRRALAAGLKACGFTSGQAVTSVSES